MWKYVGVAAFAGVLVVGSSMPASGQSTSLEEVLAASAAGAQSRSYVDDPDDYLNYRSTESTSNCGGNSACDITSSSFVIPKSSPDSIIALAGMAGRTDPELSNSEKGGLYLFVDSDDDHTDWEYLLGTRYQSYPLMEVVASWVYAWDGDSWEKTEFAGAWLRAETAWGATFPYKKLGITSAIFRVTAYDSSGTRDSAPGENGTPLLPMAALVAGAPGQPTGLTATPGMGQVSLSWKAPVSTGTSAVTAYTVTASPGGRNCTTSSTTCTVTGLTGGTAYSFTVTATNAQGTGPASDPASATPGASVPTAPSNVKATYAVKGGKTTATVSWTRPAGATSMQVRWAPNGGSWSAWKAVKVDRIAVPGLVKGKTTSFEVRGVNAGGPGAAASLTLSPK